MRKWLETRMRTQRCGVSLHRWKYMGVPKGVQGELSLERARIGLDRVKARRVHSRFRGLLFPRAESVNCNEAAVQIKPERAAFTRRKPPSQYLITLNLKVLDKPETRETSLLCFEHSYATDGHSHGNAEDSILLNSRRALTSCLVCYPCRGDADLGQRPVKGLRAEDLLA